MVDGPIDIETNQGLRQYRYPYRLRIITLKIIAFALPTIFSLEYEKYWVTQFPLVLKVLFNHFLTYMPDRCHKIPIRLKCVIFPIDTMLQFSLSLPYSSS